LEGPPSLPCQGNRKETLTDFFKELKKSFKGIKVSLFLSLPNPDIPIPALAVGNSKVGYAEPYDQF